jgi:uncharacterized protein (TIGR03437 family)
VISAGAFGAFTSIASGSWIEIYGSNFAAGNQGWSTSDFDGLIAPTTLAGTRVSIGGRAAYVNYISPSQVNVLVPAGVSPGPQSLSVTNAVGTSTSFPVTVETSKPGLFAHPSFNVGGRQFVGALFPDGTYVLPPGAVPGISSRRARPGDTIILYGVGFGSVNPNVPVGQIAQQLNALTAALQIRFGGVQATVSYSGLALGFVGLYQFNVVVPSIPASDATSLTFTLGGVNGTQTLSIAVGN